MTAIRSIDTRYAGCWFRSRLEARWAVAFDEMGVRWEYEPQGYKVTHRITDSQFAGAPEGYKFRTFPYLPDFWLPDFHCFAEVKGSLSAHGLCGLLEAAASLSSPAGGCCHRDDPGHDVVVLGPVPDPRDACFPLRLHMHRGELSASIFNLMDGIVRSPKRPRCRNDGLALANDIDGFYFSTADKKAPADPDDLLSLVVADFDWSNQRAPQGTSWEDVTDFLLHPSNWKDAPEAPDDWNSRLFLSALTDARSARFERGAQAV